MDSDTEQSVHRKRTGRQVARGFVWLSGLRGSLGKHEDQQLAERDDCSQETQVETKTQGRVVAPTAGGGGGGLGSRNWTVVLFFGDGGSGVEARPVGLLYSV